MSLFFNNSCKHFLFDKYILYMQLCLVHACNSVCLFECIESFCSRWLEGGNQFCEFVWSFLACGMATTSFEVAVYGGWVVTGTTTTCTVLAGEFLWAGPPQARASMRRPSSLEEKRSTYTALLLFSCTWLATPALPFSLPWLTRRTTTTRT